MPLSSSLLIPLLTEGSHSPLFVIPSSGSTPLALTSLRNSLRDSGIRLFSFLPSGIDEGQPIHSKFEEVARAYIQELKEIQPEGPYRIMGHCIGGITAHEIVKQLESDNGKGGNILILLDSFAPHLLQRKENCDMPVPAKAVIAKEIETAITKLQKNLETQLSRLPPAQAQRFLETTFAQLGMDADYFATPTQAQIHLITTAAHPADVFLDWEHLSDKPLTRHPISGETFSILQPPEVSSLAETLKKILALDS